MTNLLEMTDLLKNFYHSYDVFYTLLVKGNSAPHKDKQALN